MTNFLYPTINEGERMSASITCPACKSGSASAVEQHETSVVHQCGECGAEWIGHTVAGSDADRTDEKQTRLGLSFGFGWDRFRAAYREFDPDDWS